MSIRGLSSQTQPQVQDACDRCGFPLRAQHCQEVCDNCGARLDCSDVPAVDRPWNARPGAQPEWRDDEPDPTDRA